MSEDQRSAKSFNTLKDYKPPVYNETVWPVVSNRREEASFVTTNFERVAQVEFVVDPMFEDFNIITTQTSVENLSELSGAIELSSEAGDFEFAPVDAPILGNANEASLKDDGEEVIKESVLAGYGELAAQQSDHELESGDDYLEEDVKEALDPPHDELQESPVFEEAHSLSESQPDALLENEQFTGDLVDEDEEPNLDAQPRNDIARGDYESENLRNLNQGILASPSELSDVSGDGGEVYELSPELLAEAYAKGCRDTRDEVSQAQSQLEERYALLWEDMQNQVDELVKLHEAKAVELALAVAKRLVGDVVDERRDYIQGVVSHAVELSHGAKILSVRVGPHDFEFLKLSQYAEQTRLLLGEGVKFVSDDSIRAGCVLVTSAGEVDLNLDAAWERIRARVLAKG